MARLTKKQKQKQKLLFIGIAVLFVLLGFLSGMASEKFLTSKKIPASTKNAQGVIDLAVLQEQVIPQKGFKFKIKWGDLGKKMIEDGVIDEKKLAQAISGTDSLPQNVERYMKGNVSEIEVNAENAQFWVDVLWGLGLANKNKILDEGPMITTNGSAANYASTGGYTLGQVDPMQLYSKFSYINLSDQQQKVVQEIADGVFRPCCGNSTAFPDCNHGMAALGLIELMVSQGKSKDEIYKTVLAFNSYWFPQTYLDVAYHFKKAGRDYVQVPASQILSKTFSSAMGYQAIRREVGQLAWPVLKGAGSCGA